MKVVLTICFILVSLGLYAQDENKNEDKTEINNIKELFSKGKTKGNLRNFFMTTINEGSLRDYWTNAVGGSLHYQSASWKGFQFGLEGVFRYKAFSSDLNQNDTLIGKSSKWERELYNIGDRNFENNLSQLQQIYLKYSFGKKRSSFVQFGKFGLDKTPLLTKRDGRMNPYMFGGAWAEINALKNQKIQIGWINKVAPRSRTEWYSIEQAIGLNNNGFQPDGTKAKYHQIAGSKGIGIIGYTNTSIKNLKIQFWDFYFDKLANTNWLQLDYKKGKFIGGFQYVRQTAASAQKNIEYESRFYQPNQTGNLFVFKAGYKSKKVEMTANYLHALATGRFVFPRELGRERLYTSLPRGWFEGLGDANVLTFIFKFKPKEGVLNKFSSDIRLMNVYTAGINNFEFNKYNIQSYTQLNAILEYKLDGFMKGMDFQLLYIVKKNHKNTDTNPQLIFNKTNYTQINFITNIRF